LSTEATPTQQSAEQLEQAIILQAQTGDQVAMQALYQQYAQRAYNLALRLLCHQADAQDVMQDAFVKCFKSLHQYRADGSFWAWFSRIVSTTALMQMRSDKRRGQEIEMSEVVTEAVLISAADATSDVIQAELAAALARLPALSRTVIWLYHMEGYTHSEIAEMLGYTVSFSKSRLSRARRELRVFLSSSPNKTKGFTGAIKKQNRLSDGNDIPYNNALPTALFEINQ